MARPKDQSRRRAELLEAAAEAVLERGAGGVRLKDIADRIGVTPASILYYYGDLSKVYEALFERSTTYYAKKRAEDVDRVDGFWQKLTACIRSGVPFPGEGEVNARVLIELFPMSFRSSTVGALQKRFIQEQSDLYVSVLTGGADAGEFQLIGSAEFHAREFIALEDGYTIDVLCQAATAEEVEAAMIRHAHTVTGREEAGSS